MTTVHELTLMARGFNLPMGNYVRGDAGFPVETMVLTPYRRVGYHLKEWGKRNWRPRTAAELFKCTFN